MFYYKYIKSSFFSQASDSQEGEGEKKTQHGDPFHKVWTESMTMRAESLQKAIQAVDYSIPEGNIHIDQIINHQFSQLHYVNDVLRSFTILRS